METNRLIERFVAFPPNAWRALALKAAWHYRTGGQAPMPAKILAITGGEIPTREAWDEVRKGVAAKRRQDKYLEAKYVREQRALARQSYMRNYMRNYRARKAG